MLRVVKSPFEELELWQIELLLLLLWQYPQDVRVADLVSLFFLNRQFGPALRTIVVRSILCVVLLPLLPIFLILSLVSGIKISLSLRHCAWIYATVFLLFFDTLAGGILVLA